MSSPDLDPLIHTTARLRLMVALESLPDGDSVTFTKLQDVLALTPGNLSTHLRKLEDAGYLAVTKTFRRRVPVTYVELTKTGRQAFADYRAALDAILSPDHPL